MISCCAHLLPEVIRKPESHRPGAIMGDNMNDKKSIAIFSLAFCGLLVSAAVHAQAEIDEIVVTAQKREQSLQEVPLSVSAMTGETLRTLGIDNVVDLQAQVPNLNIGSPLGEANVPNLSIRGVGISDWADTQESPVAMYIDGIYLGSLAGQTINLFRSRSCGGVAWAAGNALWPKHDRWHRSLYFEAAHAGIRDWRDR